MFKQNSLCNTSLNTTNIIKNLTLGFQKSSKEKKVTNITLSRIIRDGINVVAVFKNNINNNLEQIIPGMIPFFLSSVDKISRDLIHINSVTDSR